MPVPQNRRRKSPFCDRFPAVVFKLCFLVVVFQMVFFQPLFLSAVFNEISTVLLLQGIIKPEHRKPNQKHPERFGEGFRGQIRRQRRTEHGQEQSG